MEDIRAEVARYYDLNPQPPADIPFYRALLPSPQASVLELGCGSGRVLVPLARSCGFIDGIDSSQAMLQICRDKLGETAAQLDGLFRCVRAHLSATGTCVLNVFRPKWQAREWLRDDETFNWEVRIEGGRVTCHDRRRA